MLQGPTQSFSARGNSFLRRASYPGAPCTKTTPRLLSVPKACDQNSGRAEAIASGLMKLIHVRLWSYERRQSTCESLEWAVKWVSWQRL